MDKTLNQIALLGIVLNTLIILSSLLRLIFSSLAQEENPILDIDVISSSFLVVFAILVVVIVIFGDTRLGELHSAVRIILIFLGYLFVPLSIVLIFYKGTFLSGIFGGLIGLLFLAYSYQSDHAKAFLGRRKELTNSLSYLFLAIFFLFYIYRFTSYPIGKSPLGNIYGLYIILIMAVLIFIAAFIKKRV